MARRNEENAPANDAGDAIGKPELVVIANAGGGLRAPGGAAEALFSVASADVSPLAAALSARNARLVPLFGPSEERVNALVAGTAATFAAFDTVSGNVLPPLPDLATYYTVEADGSQEELEAMAEELRSLDLVDGAFVRPAPRPAVIDPAPPDPNVAPPVTPDFSGQQGYLMVAPGGVNAIWAHSRPGGRGGNVRVIDIEGEWRFTHEDLGANQGGMVGGVAPNNLGWRNHGTAVIGEISGDVNGFGVTGISPDATVSAISIFGPGMSPARAITDAANRLRAGDVILIELHAPGPRFNFTAPQGQRGFIAMEWWPDILAAIQFATRRGVIVVEAAGNGFENLDDPIYDVRPPGFPPTWVNPFRRGAVDSGAIVVGAGAPPSGSFGPDRCRLDFSNFGALVDAQGWGREVVTTGYGDLQGGPNEDVWYTRTFSGTSSASPIVVGAVACVQGMLQAANRAVLTPAQTRNLLRTTGSPQQNGPNGTTAQRIGNRPDLRGIATQLGLVPSKNINKEIIKEAKELVKERKDAIKELKEVRKELKDRKEIIKEIKEKDRKELKEKDRKEIKEKDIKEKDREGGLGGGGGVLGGPGLNMTGNETADPNAEYLATLEARLAQLEMGLLELTHFITGDLRPDLLGAALEGEEGG
jgi:hypothetical protein